MRIVYRSMAITLAALSLSGRALAASVETVLHSFAGGSDGADPEAGLIADEQGALYGTTFAGGSSNNGTVFKLTPHANGRTDWTKAVLYSFCSQPSCSDGAVPIAGLIADDSGALYGTTSGGGAGSNGTVFKLTPPAWTETVLYNFCSQPSCSDGVGPVAGLIADKSGALYGTTHAGGSSGNGTVFKLTPPAWTETVLYSFLGGSDGGAPRAGLIADEQDTLYGTTTGGGIANNGTVFKLTPPTKGQSAWKETVLHRFCSQPGCSDGSGPVAGLTADERGVLYGTTGGGGSSGVGTVFNLTVVDPWR
jgi:uncharacterized repeat protein (TIGR03803 family)